MRLVYPDHHDDPAAWATGLGVSREACDLLLDADFIDLHCDLEVPVRLLRYDPTRRHAPHRRPLPFFGHTDYPRLLEAGFTGIVADLATNVFRRGGRLEVTRRNLERMKQRVEQFPEQLALVTDRSGYDRARKEGRLALWLALQGGNAISEDPSVLEGPIGRLLHRITLVHLTSSDLGGTNSPLGADRGLSPAGRDFVKACNAARVLVDLAHIGKRSFWEALEVHDTSLPPIVSHTGTSGVYPHWRNVDDDQVRAIADRGGVIGVIYQSSFLERRFLRGRRGAILDHLQHVVDVAGEDFAALGTDYDGLIVPPADLPDVTHHPVLVQDMLDRGWSERRIRKILGQNYLRVVANIRP
jgi:membrane dipeptidase